MVESGRAFRIIVGVMAVVAPAAHTLTDIMEWLNNGFSGTQLWINYIAFVPMSWLLLGLYAVQKPLPGMTGLTGALLYGASFTYFAFTTLFALELKIPDYETLWNRLGMIYTFHGALMIVGGLMFGYSAWKVNWLPRISLIFFLSGIMTNLILGIIPAPDILQTIGSTLRNTGLMIMGFFVVQDGIKASVFDT